MAVLRQKAFDIAHLYRLNDEQLVKRVKANDDAALTVLLERYKPLVRKRTYHYFLAGGDKDDLVQEGMVGLFKAARDYRPQVGTPFKAFAEVCIERQLLTAIKNGTRNKQSPLNTYVPLVDDRGESAPSDMTTGLPGRSSDPAEVVVLRERLSCLADGLSHTLSGFEKLVFSEYVVGKSYVEIARDVHKRAKSVDNALQRAKKKLEEYMEEKYQ